MAKKKTKNQKKLYLAVFLGTPSSMKKWDRLPTKTRMQREKEGMRAWHVWASKNKKSIANMGAPLGTTKRISKKGVANTHNELGAFTVVRATSHAAAAKLFKKHPHFMIFPGDSVEVMECLKIPSMPK